MEVPNSSSSFPSFGARLRYLRRAAGIKQLSVALAIGVDQATVSRWERGEQTPTKELQERAWSEVRKRRFSDAALKRLVESSAERLHLVEETAHICLAYSRPRAEDWGASQRTLLGVSLWPFATEEIQKAEAELARTGWWNDPDPAPRVFHTSEKLDRIHISAGLMRWERVLLSDGTPVRLVSAVGSPHI